MSNNTEEDVGLDEEYSVKLTKTTNPKDVTDDEDKPVKATEKHYDVHSGGKKVGEVVHHHNDYGGHFFNATLHGKKVPFDRQNKGEMNAKAFIDGVAKSKWHAKTVKEASETFTEESLGAATLKAGSRPAGTDPKSKIEFMTAALGAMNGMKKEDLSKWFDQAMALIGKEASSLPAGASADANQSSVDMKTGKGPKTRDAMPKLSVREDVEDMFVGEDLSEEFKDKASTLFEAAVNARVTVELAKLEEEFDAKLDEELGAAVESIEKGLDSYLDYVVEKWMEDNQVAIESSLRNEIMEEFIGGLKGLFAEHYIDVPEDKVDVLEALTAKVEQLEGSLSEAIEENTELKGVLTESKRQEVLADLAEGLTMTQTEKFFALAEGIEFDGDLDVYTKKLSVVKENYFVKSAAKSNLEEETFEVDTAAPTVSYDPSVNRYAQAISRTVKK